MGWQQYTYLVLLVLGLGISMAKHGEPKNERHNFWSTLLASMITFGLLYSGGFFG